MFRGRFVYQGTTGKIESELPLEVGPPEMSGKHPTPVFVCLFVSGVHMLKNAVNVQAQVTGK